MRHLVGHGPPSQDVINTTEGSFTHTNRYYVTGTTTENRRGKRKEKKQATIITRPRQDGSVVVWMRTLQSKLFNYK